MSVSSTDSTEIHISGIARDSIVDGEWVVQNFYLSKTGSTATIRRTGLDQTSGGERADDADRSEAPSTTVS